MTACRRSSMPNSPTVSSTSPYALPIVQARFQGIKPALNGIMYNFDRWWVPKDLQRYHVRP